MKILLIEDEKITRITLTNTLKKEGFDVVSCETGVEGLARIEKESFDVIVTDLRLPGMNGMDILKTVKEKYPETMVIIITAFATVETAVDALKIGAYDYLTKPFSPDKLLSTLTHIRQFHEVRNENVKLKKRLRIFENKVIVGSSPLMSKLLEKIKAVAQNDYTVLIEGESGSGKEMVARALHYYSSRVKNPFIPINCAVIPESLLESELFGHEKGAFSGAVKRHVGYFERADKGTIFIDDIDDFPLPLQVKLLRVLQEREFLRVGGIESVSVDVRIICASKIDLKEHVNKNLFREDLYYRLNIIPLRIPPLRKRKDDIPALVEHFFDKNNARDKLRLLNKNIYSRFLQYDWPGNVRELENFVERMIALSDVSSWDDEIFESLQTDYPCKEETVESKEKEYPSYQEYINKKEQEIIEWAMKKTDNNVSRAAELLGLPRSTLRSKMKKN